MQNETQNYSPPINQPSQPTAVLGRKSSAHWVDEVDKAQSLRSLFYFASNVLGYPLQKEPHEELCSFIQDTSTNLKLILTPRGSMKTSICSQAFPIWLLLKNPNYRILLDSEILQNSKRNLNVIKSIFQSNKRMNYLFGNNYNPEFWTQDEIFISSRANYLIKEPSIGTGSIDTIQVGPHWNMIVLDDPHSEKNTRTKDQIDLVYEHIRLLFSLGDVSDFRLIIIGTRWCEGDVFGRIIDDHPAFAKLVRPAIFEDGRIYYPKMFPKDVLTKIKLEQGPDMFNAQYMNDPMPQGENASFRKEYFKYASQYPNDISLVLSVDPAISTEPGSDYFAMVAWGIDKNNQTWVCDYQYGNYSPSKAMQVLWGLVDKHTNIRKIGIESIAFQRLFKFEIEAEMRRRGKYMEIHEIKSHKQSKDQRILSLQPRYSNGAITHMDWMRNGELEEELLKYPRGKKRDVADALSFMTEIAVPRTPPRQVKPSMVADIDYLIREHLKNKEVNKQICNPYLGHAF